MLILALFTRMINLHLLLRYRFAIVHLMPYKRLERFLILQCTPFANASYAGVKLVTFVKQALGGIIIFYLGKTLKSWYTCLIPRLKLCDALCLFRGFLFTGQHNRQKAATKQAQRP